MKTAIKILISLLVGFVVYVIFSQISVPASACPLPKGATEVLCAETVGFLANPIAWVIILVVLIGTFVLLSAIKLKKR